MPYYFGNVSCIKIFLAHRHLFGIIYFLRFKNMKKPKSKKTKPTKVVKTKKTSLVNINQLEALKEWLEIYSKTKKLPHNRIVCSVCSMNFIGLKGIGMSHAMKKFDGDMKRVLTESVCKDCKPKEQKEPKPKVAEFLTREEMEYRSAEISASLHKMKFRDPIIIDLSKNKDECKKWTYFACHRPDIYLDYGCEECNLSKHCACPIKNLARKPDAHRKKRK